MSEFLINKSVQELNLDFYEWGLNEEFAIVTDGTFIKLNASGLATSDTLLTYYLDQALKFSMLKECFFEQLSSLYEFATNHYLSHNPVYKEFKQFKLLLKESDIAITKDFQLVGEEKEVREFVFLFFMKVHSLNQFPFPKEIREKQQSFARFNDQPWFDPEQSARMQIRKKQYLGIVITRILHGHFLENSMDNDLVLPKHQLIIEEILTWLVELAPTVTKDILEREAKDILRFLIVEGWLVDNQTYIDQEQPYIQQLNTNFLAAIEPYFDLSTDTLVLLHKEMTTIHYQLLSFSFISRYECHHMDVTYFLEMYPEYAAFCRNYLDKNRNRPIFWNNKEFLFFRYLILMVSIIPLQEILGPLYVCVDFSFGYAYNQMIQKNIVKILDLNICFQDFLTDDTQLILSDLPFYGALAIDHILWLAPPRPIDWANFTEKVNQIRKEQFRAENNQ